MAKEKGRDREIRIVDRNAPRIAIQISEIRFQEKQKTRHRESVAHLTVTNLFGTEAKKIIMALRELEWVDFDDFTAPATWK